MDRHVKSANSPHEDRLDFYISLHKPSFLQLNPLSVKYETFGKRDRNISLRENRDFFFIIDVFFLFFCTSIEVISLNYF